MDAVTLELDERRHVEAAVRDAHGEDHTAGLDLGPAGDRARSFRAHRLDIARDDEGCAEDPCLLIGALRELRSAEAT